jgi:hypothetical protein
MFAVYFYVSKITETFIQSFCQPRAEARERRKCIRHKKAGSNLVSHLDIFKHGVPPFVN